VSETNLIQTYLSSSDERPPKFPCDPKWLRGHCDGYDVTIVNGIACPHCATPLRVTAVRYIDESGFSIVCEACHADVVQVERR